ncbi:MAG: carboxypeptidase regulatory-like domain-containing protein, partial [Bdellovibrionota bacterium]
MRSGLTRSFFLAALVFLEPALALAFTPTITPSGAQVSWRNGRKLNLAGNPTNTSGLSDYDVFQAVTRGLRRWESASGGGIHFDYWQGSDPVVYEPDSSYNGLSSLYFASNARGDTRLTPNVLGLTQVWYNTDNGEILETDVVLNDRDFRFTTDPRDTSGTGSGSTSFYAGKSNVYIENVITHELGHAFGLSHSGGLQSTMLFMESPEQAHLSCDEGVAVHAIYPTADAGARGNITGTVVSDYGQPIFGAHVEAISRQRGTVLATAMTDRGGNYALRALEPGTYFLLVEPYYAGASALPQYYAAMSPVICGGQTFARTFLVDNSGYTPVPIGVAAGGTTPAPTLTAHCTGGSAAAVSGAASAPVIYSGGSGFGIVDRLAGGGAYPYADKEYTVQSVAGHLEIHAVSYSL